MTLNFKKMLFVCLVVIATQFVKAQDADKTVTLTVTGSGKTQEEAKQVGLRSAIEQAYGAFISTKTEIFNDQIVADQIASVASGNIQSFQVLSESQFPNGTWGVTLKVLVSVNKLTSFVQAKGIAVEINGGMFAVNIKQQMLNEQGEINAVYEMVGVLHEILQTSFDYAIKSGDPQARNDNSERWDIPLEVIPTANKNMDFCANYCINTLTALSLTPTEVENYKKINKQIFPFWVSYKGKVITIFLRKETSTNALSILVRNWTFYKRLFIVQYDHKEIPNTIKKDEPYSESNNFLLYLLNKEKESFEILQYGGDQKNSRRAFDERRYTEEHLDEINFSTAGRQAASFTWNDQNLTLKLIEQITGYKVKPIGIKFPFKHGGFVVYEKDGHGLVAATLGYTNETRRWEHANTECEELVLNGYSDWRLPTIGELKEIFKINERIEGENYNYLFPLFPLGHKSLSSSIGVGSDSLLYRQSGRLGIYGDYANRGKEYTMYEGFFLPVRTF